MLVAEREEDVENNLNILDEVMAKWSMKVNWGKTKALVVKRGGGSCNVSVKGSIWVLCSMRKGHVKMKLKVESGRQGEPLGHLGRRLWMVGS